jgi:hypothetical protein
MISGLQSCKQLLSLADIEVEFKVRVWDLITKAARICAESAKMGEHIFGTSLRVSTLRFTRRWLHPLSERARDPIGDAGAIELFVDFLNMNDNAQHTDAAVQCLRAVGNLCADNGLRERVNFRRSTRIVFAY